MPHTPKVDKEAKQVRELTTGIHRASNPQRVFLLQRAPYFWLHGAPCYFVLYISKIAFLHTLDIYFWDSVALVYYVKKVRMKDEDQE